MSETIDLTACDREPVTIPGSIQPHGVLLGVRGAGHTIVRASANSLEFLGVDPAELLGRSLGECFDEASSRRLDEAAQQEDPTRNNPLSITGGSASEKHFDGIVHRCKADLILELERTQSGTVGTSVRGALPRLQGAFTETEACWIAAEEARRLTFFDRVMIYRFASDWSGEVVAEARGDGVDSYLGTHFPASDIPKQARDLYTRKLLGYIPDVNYSPVPLFTRFEEPVLDMSRCVLRSVSPIHLEYLRNMGVAATLTVSLIIKGKLWGMIACHHGNPLFHSFTVRQDCQFLGQVAAAQIGARAAAAHQIYRFKRTGMLANFLNK